MERKTILECDGFVAGLRLVSPAATTDYRERLEQFIAIHSADPRFCDWTYLKSHLLLAWVGQLAREQSVLDAVEQILGPHIVLWDSFIPVKRPQSSSYYGWHQDGTYWSVEPLNEIVTVWIALDRVDKQNGAMQVVMGSQTGGLVEHERTFDPDSKLRRGQQLRDSIDVTNVVTVALEAGEASIHNPFIVHGSGPNRSDRWRLGVGLVYISDKVGPKSGHLESGLLLRGNRHHPGLRDERVAEVDLGVAELGEYERVIRNSATRYDDVPKADWSVL